MTINILYVRDDMSIILSDRRLTYGLKGENGFSDDNNKLIDLKDMGWATGAGLYNFIVPFNERLAETSITSENQLINLFQKVMNETLVEFPRYREKMYSSKVSFSLIDDNEEKTAKVCKILRLNKYKVDKGIVEFLPRGYFQVVPPSDFPNHLLNNLVAMKKREGKRLEDEELHDILLLFLETFEELSRDSKLSSKECDIGIYRLSDNEIHKLKLSGNVYDLLSKLNKESAENYIEVIENKSIQ